MLNYLLLTSLIIAAVSALFALVRQNQMLQQNSYFPSRYFAWVKDGYTAPLALECIGFSFSSVLYERKLYAAQLILIIAVFAFPGYAYGRFFLCTCVLSCVYFAAFVPFVPLCNRARR